MKNILFLAAALFTINLSASIVPSFIKEVKAKSVVVNLSQWSKGNCTVTIENSVGEKLFSEEIKKNVSTRVYNLAKMEPGKYSIIIENEQKISIQNIEIKNDGILASPTIKEIFKPTFIVDKDSWSVQALNLNKDSEVVLYDENGNIVYSAKIDTPKVAKKFNVEKLNPGYYELTYKIGERTFSKFIEKK